MALEEFQIFYVDGLTRILRSFLLFLLVATLPVNNGSGMPDYILFDSGNQFGRACAVFCIRGVPVPQIKEDIVENLVGEQILDVPVPQIQGGVLPLTPTGPRAESYVGFGSGCASAPVQGGRLAPRTTGAFAESW